mmetsp:Transcript_84705/g.244841  ORF Transcript_84705/g.244841 Transcript_84705/m.244841 type:complete len:254 (-) Transcript_84705:554-1315(-)
MQSASSIAGCPPVRNPPPVVYALAALTRATLAPLAKERARSIAKSFERASKTMRQTGRPNASPGATSWVPRSISLIGNSAVCFNHNMAVLKRANRSSTVGPRGSHWEPTHEATARNADLYAASSSPRHCNHNFSQGAMKPARDAATAAAARTVIVSRYVALLHGAGKVNLFEARLRILVYSFDRSANLLPMWSHKCGSTNAERARASTSTSMRPAATLAIDHTSAGGAGNRRTWRRACGQRVCSCSMREKSTL